MKPELVGSCIVGWTEQRLYRVTLLSSATMQKLTYQLQIVTAESLTRLLPSEENSVHCNFLLKLLKLGILMETDPELINLLERQIGWMLDHCYVTDLLVNNFGENEEETTYDVGIVVRALKSYVSSLSMNPWPKIHTVGRLVYGYRAVIAREGKLGMESFYSIFAYLPKDAFVCHHDLY
ncbi:hypothetical protein SAY86_001342 [Trapa natans]|uniref:NPH3 domain-containing protein n=1 Tax=Trapa natans TaxID=22666 RepID=A0AAN7MCG6_TRANT|nr:hypothetical protein SAY86_001342 [Trapa natans]